MTGRVERIDLYGDKSVGLRRRCQFSDRVWRPGQKGAQAPHYDSRRFFYVCSSVLWRLCVGDLRVCRVPFPGSPTCVQLPPSFGDEAAAPIRKELHMTTLIPSAIRALAHRRMALSALRASSSLSVRLKRYNHHMDQVRALESQGGAQ